MEQKSGKQNYKNLGTKVTKISKYTNKNLGKKILKI
jgi:hypothetical protein